MTPSTVRLNTRTTVVSCWARLLVRVAWSGLLAMVVEQDGRDGSRGDTNDQVHDLPSGHEKGRPRGGIGLQAVRVVRGDRRRLALWPCLGTG